MLEQTLIAYLLDRGFDVYAEAPSSSTGRFVVVERTGGYTLHRRIEQATVAVQSWAPSTLGASELAAEVDAALLEMPDHVPNVSYIGRNSLYRFNAEQRPRYQGTYEITFMEV